MLIEKTIMFKTTLPNGKTISANSEEELKELYKKKTTYENQKIEINFPIIITALNDNEFDLFEYALGIATDKKISYRKFENEMVTHGAVFWIGETEPLETEKVMKEFDDKCEL